ncbi:MAG: hypothetical protein KBD01_18500 [Acidobacteria bacterium]|nr:hypothetical protein [Acidobacteriota bacterium]
MDRIGVVGIPWRRGGAEALARLTIPVEERAERLPRIAREIGAPELVYIATCNRVEIAFAADGGTPMSAYRPRLFAALEGRPARPGEAERALLAWAGEGAAEHLFVVAAGLDSARAGETEIAGQVRQALETSRDLGLLGPRLELVLDEALKVAARVHRSTGVNEGPVSLAGIAIDHVKDRLARTPGPVALVGVSPMTVRCGRALAGAGWPLVVVNRTLARAEELAAETGGRAVALEEFRRRPEAVEAVVLATAAPDPVLGRPELERLAARAPSGEPPLLVDLAVPPDVAPADAAAAGLQRIGMKEVLAEAEANRGERLVELADARAMVDEALLELRRRLAERVLAPLLGALQRRYRQTAIEGVERLLSRELKGLGETEREAVRRWAETLARRFAHIPSLGLRGLACEGGLSAVETFLAGLDEALARELRDAAEGTTLIVPADDLS